MDTKTNKTEKKEIKTGIRIIHVLLVIF